jgi:LysR family transcriptional regulator, glycine cleavage system transcriptional activator
MRKLPPLTELRAFEAAARHLSFKLAAAELGVTPTAISHQLKLLERHCGQTLFRRRPRPLALTQAGQQLFPVVREGFETFAEALNKMRSGGASGRLGLTATNAFTARWLVPRLPHWREIYPRLKLDIIGTDAVIDLDSGDVDLAIRYARKPPKAVASVELFRDEFYAVASPKIVGDLKRPLQLAELGQLPLIEAEWPAADPDAPRWQRWQRVAGRRHRTASDMTLIPSMSFREELHAIEAAIAGQGVAICSTILVQSELASGALVPVSRVKLPGYGFYIAHRADHPKMDLIKAFINWARQAGER